MAKKRTRLKETREDVFADMVQERRGFEDTMTFQEFNEQVTEERQLSPLDEEGAALNVFDQSSGRRQSQMDIGTTTDDLFSARRLHESRSEVAQGRDEAVDAQRVTGDFETWGSAPDQFDFPGIDTTDAFGPIFD